MQNANYCTFVLTGTPRVLNHGHTLHAERMQTLRFNLRPGPAAGSRSDLAALAAITAQRPRLMDFLPQDSELLPFKNPSSLVILFKIHGAFYSLITTEEPRALAHCSTLADLLTHFLL